mmetsp:Transcript_16175/g.50135  ORF Transcript_16175/g.50135 Transcript_16175/m.50135 type:complete len:354 (-) Transcript_16175:17-1078(-)
MRADRRLQGLVVGLDVVGGAHESDRGRRAPVGNRQQETRRHVGRGARDEGDHRGPRARVRRVALLDGVHGQPETRRHCPVGGGPEGAARRDRGRVRPHELGQKSHVVRPLQTGGLPQSQRADFRSYEEVPVRERRCVATVVPPAAPRRSLRLGPAFRGRADHGRLSRLGHVAPEQQIPAQLLVRRRGPGNPVRAQGRGGPVRRDVHSVRRERGRRHDVRGVPRGYDERIQTVPGGARPRHDDRFSRQGAGARGRLAGGPAPVDAPPAARADVEAGLDQAVVRGRPGGPDELARGRARPAALEHAGVRPRGDDARHRRDDSLPLRPRSHVRAPEGARSPRRPYYRSRGPVGVPE